MANYECTIYGVTAADLCQSQHINKEIHCGADTTKLRKMYTDISEQTAYGCGTCGHRTDNPHLRFNTEKLR